LSFVIILRLTIFNIPKVIIYNYIIGKKRLVIEGLTVSLIITTTTTTIIITTATPLTAAYLIVAQRLISRINTLRTSLKVYSTAS
jgi:hypothetical protein